MVIQSVQRHVRSSEQNPSTKQQVKCPQIIVTNSPHIDQWMRMLVSAMQQTGGSQDYLVCLQPLTILNDQSHISTVLLTQVQKYNRNMIMNWLGEIHNTI